METYLEFFEALKNKQSRITFIEFMQNPPTLLYAKKLGPKGYYMETWEFKRKIKNAFSAGYRLKKSGPAKELLPQVAYNLFKKGELLCEKYHNQN